MKDQRSQDGITLVEVAVVGVLATIVMLALTGFYINSQGTWIDASTQAVTQREVTFVVETIADSVHASASSYVTLPHVLILYDHLGAEKCRFWWNPADSLIHEGYGTTIDRGPLGNSKVTAFDVTEDSTHRMVRLLAVQMRSANGRLITMTTNAAYCNR